MYEKINEYRHAALNDYIICHDLLIKLLMDLDFMDSLKYGIAKAKNHLPMFERMHPTIQWPREFLMLLEKPEPFEFSIPSYHFFGEGGILDKVGMPSPGSVAYFNALGELKCALDYHLKNWRDESLMITGSAVSEIIWARVRAHWGLLYPTEYRQYYNAWKEQAMYLDNVIGGNEENPKELEEIQERMHVFDRNNEAKRFLLGLRLELADDIEELWSKSETK